MAYGRNEEDKSKWHVADSR